MKIIEGGVYLFVDQHRQIEPIPLIIQIKMIEKEKIAFIPILDDKFNYHESADAPFMRYPREIFTEGSLYSSYTLPKAMKHMELKTKKLLFHDLIRRLLEKQNKIEKE
jgi:hypothetical protein